MANAFSRSWEITKLSFNVIKQDKELILFPFLAGIFSLIFMAAMIIPSILPMFLADNQLVAHSLTILEYIILFIIYLGIAFIATFFNVCVVYTTKKRFEGGNATFGESIGFAFSKIHLILSWSLLAATVGLILRLIDRLAERMGNGGRIVVSILNSILGMIWSIITIFVVPAMVYNNLGPFAAIKRSVQVLKKTWGESLIRYYGLGLVQFLLLFIGIIIFVGLIIASTFLGIYAVLVVVILAILYFLGVILIFTVANSIFNTALYEYADKGTIPAGYNQEVLSHAFQAKKPSMLGGTI